MISEKNVPDGFTFAATECASTCSANASLQTFLLPLSSPNSDELTFQELELHSLNRCFDGHILFENLTRVDLPVASLPIVVSSNGKLKIFSNYFLPFPRFVVRSASCSEL